MISWKIFCRLILSVIRIRVATQSASRIIDRSRCSVPTCVVCSLRASFSLFSRMFLYRGLSDGLLFTSASVCGTISSSISRQIFSSSTPFRASICPATPEYSLRRPSRRCSVPIYGCCISFAFLAAYLMAFSACFVYDKCICSSCHVFILSKSTITHNHQISHPPGHALPDGKYFCSILSQAQS